MTRPFSDISRRFLTRRRLLQETALAGSALALTGSAFASQPRPRAVVAPGFEGMPHGRSANHAITAGYEATVLLRWGDGLGGETPASFPLSEDWQARSFGFNNDYIAYLPLEGSRRGLLSINHEYPLPHLMFPAYADFESAVKGMSAAQTRSEMMSVGHSVIEVELAGDRWAVVGQSRYQRRLTAATPIRLDGPAAGHSRLRTGADPEARTVLGLLSCCSGGKTPWGTVLIAEENFGDFFSGDINALQKSLPAEADGMREFEVNEEFLHWARADHRFDINREPHEFNRFGWIVELDPFDPNSVPVKRTALGRFEHEGACVVSEPGRPVVVYSGDDEEDQCLYRFVSSEPYDPDQPVANRELLSNGVLYCARFDDDGTGRWLPMVHGQGPLLESAGFNNQGDVLIDCRRAAALLGATPMDRPEGIAAHTESGRVYAALTKNKEKTAANAANPRHPNPAGHILELLPPGRDGSRDHWSDRFNWDLLLQAGAPAGIEQPGQYGEPLASGDWFANPDNLAFDGRGRLWVATDGCEDFGFADGLWCSAIDGEARARPRHFLRCPRGAELCGPEFTPDGRSLFVAIQHPADEDDSSYGRPSTRWPDFSEQRPPRPAVMAIRKSDGGLIGD